MHTKASATLSLSLTICLCFIVTPSPAEFGDLLYTLTDANSTGGDAFGSDVAISETTAIVGNGFPWPDPPGPENVHVFDLMTGGERYKLANSQVTATYGFGYSVAIDGNILIAGAGNRTSVGEAYLFDASTGQKLRQLKGATQVPRDDFGESVAIDGDKAIVGAFAPFPFGVGSGAAYVFDVTTGQELLRIPAAEAWRDQFGLDVDISGNIAIVGAPSQNAESNNAGAAYLYDVTTGQRLRKLRASDPATNDNFGQSVAIEGNIAIIGAPGSAASSPSGSAYVIDVTTGQQLSKLVPSDGANGDQFGYDVAISGNTAIVGAIQGTEIGSGAAYLFDVTTGQELLKVTVPEPAPINFGDLFGWSVAIDGNRAIVGARRQADSLAGAAYVFDVSRIPGDFNADGTVDAADYVVWRNDLGTKYTQSDYDVWRAHFGRMAGSGSVHEVVPEPNPAALGFVALACLILLRAKNKCRVGYYVSCAAPWREGT